MARLVSFERAVDDGDGASFADGKFSHQQSLQAAVEAEFRFYGAGDGFWSHEGLSAVG